MKNILNYFRKEFIVAQSTVEYSKLKISHGNDNYANYIFNMKIPNAGIQF